MNLIINRILCTLYQMPVYNHILLALVVFVLIPLEVHLLRFLAVLAKEEGLTTLQYMAKKLIP